MTSTSTEPVEQEGVGLPGCRVICDNASDPNEPRAFFCDVAIDVANNRKAALKHIRQELADLLARLDEELDQ